MRVRYTRKRVFAMFDSDIVLLLDLCVAAHLLWVALWVASHMCDQKYCEQKAPALIAYQITHEIVF